jgi:ABC-type nitrate/sulfonate/bicarbonate transport system substrate-binding protein
MAPALASGTPLPITAVAAILEHNDSGIISLKENGIETPAQFSGARYASWDMPVEVAMIEELARLYGVDPDTIDFIPNTVTDVVAAIQTDIDIVWVYYGWDGVAATLAGLETNYIAFRDVNPVFDYYTPVLIANNALLENEPEMVRSFLAATALGYEYAIDNPHDAADILLKHVPELGSELIHASQSYLSGQYRAEKPVWGTIDAARWSAFFKWLYDNGLIAKDIGAAGFTNEFLPVG